MKILRTDSTGLRINIPLEAHSYLYMSTFGKFLHKSEILIQVENISS